MQEARHVHTNEVRRIIDSHVATTWEKPGCCEVGVKLDKIRNVVLGPLVLRGLMF